MVPLLDLQITSIEKAPGGEMDSKISSSDSIVVLDKSLNLSSVIPYL